MRWVSLLLFLSLFACATPHYSPDTPPPSDLAAVKKAEKINEAILMNATNQSASLEENYLIGHDDLLEIEAYNVDELKKTVRVNSNGEIALPLVGIISVKGLTTAQVEQLIARKLERYVQETVVTVFVRDYKSHRITVIGAVRKPQTVALSGQRYLLDMLMIAEGVEKEAGNICYVIRPAQEAKAGSKAQTIVIDLDDLLIKGNFALNIPVFSGDVINVPRGGIFFVDGEVKAPGAHTLKGKTTLVQAIAMAQGFSPLAKSGEVRIYRDTGKPEREIITADYDEVRDGAKPDIPILENDIIIVPQDGVKNFFNGFVRAMRGALAFGTMSVGF